MNPREYLHGLEFHGIKLGLENIRTLLTAADHPQDAAPCVHIAGTNGKGSVAAFLAHILMAAGYRVGRFTSPHIFRINERFLINSEPISDETLDRHVSFFQDVAQLHLATPPTFFEMNTAIAFSWFAEEKVDISIIEVGMGGRLDSTNVVQPLACAITSIDYDHTQYLGSTLAAIAGEKAGILKRGTPVVVGVLPDEARETVLGRARELGCPILFPGVPANLGTPLAPIIEWQTPAFSVSRCPLGLAGAHQAGNAAVALALAERLRDRYPLITSDRVARGLCETAWPGRMERVSDDPAVYLDAAHNPAGTASLARTFADSKAVIIFSAAADKDHAGMILPLGQFAAHVVFTRFSGTRATQPESLASHLPSGIPRSIAPEMDEAVRIGLTHARCLGLPLVICGSIFSLGPAKTALDRLLS